MKASSNLKIENKFILNIDVLGFSNFINEDALVKVRTFYLHLISGISLAGDLFDKDNIEIMVYSDTIAIKSNNIDIQKGFIDLVKIANVIQSGQYYASLNPNEKFLPIRGSITYGDFIFHKGDTWSQTLGRPRLHTKNINLIIGKPIVDSYYLEKSMKLMCIAIHDESKQFINSGVSKNLISNNLLIKYNTPIVENKAKTHKELLLVNPIGISNQIDIYLERLNAKKEDFKTKNDIYEKYANTILFFEYIKNKKLYYPKLHEN